MCYRYTTKLDMNKFSRAQRAHAERLALEIENQGGGKRDALRVNANGQEVDEEVMFSAVVHNELPRDADPSQYQHRAELHRWANPDASTLCDPAIINAGSIVMDSQQGVPPPSIATDPPRYCFNLNNDEKHFYFFICLTVMLGMHRNHRLRHREI